MKIWYQSLFDVGRVPAYFDGVRKRVGTVARPGTEVHIHSMPEGVYGGRVPAEAVVYPYIASLHAQFILDNALRAQAEGYDVFALSSVQDPAIEEALSRSFMLGEPAEIFDNVIAPAMRRIGELWSARRISVAQEHLASGLVEATLASLHATMQPRVREPTVLLL